MSEELKPCPFCGGEPNLTHDDYVHDDLRPMPVVECKSCSAWVQAADWNRRAALSAQQSAPVCWVSVPVELAARLQRFCQRPHSSRDEADALDMELRALLASHGRGEA